MFDESRFRQAIEEATERALQKILPRLVEAARLGASANDAQRSAEAISVRTAAGRSDYSEATVLAAIERGDLSAHKPRGSREWRILLVDFEGWLLGGATRSDNTVPMSDSPATLATRMLAGGRRK